VLELLHLNDVALCTTSAARLLSVSGRLRSWLRTQLADGMDVYAYFNNDVGGHAPRDAVALRRLLETSAC
jgi:uncharacterized protein YecE (DUF72 family)